MTGTKNETPAVKNKPQENKRKGIPPQERVRNAVRATGNKWAIENFNATHYEEKYERRYKNFRFVFVI